MNRIEGLHPRTPGELEHRFPAAMAPRLDRERGILVLRHHPLYRARLTRGWSADVLAARLGVSPTTVRCWELRAFRPDPHNRRALARAFGVDLAEIDRWFDEGWRELGR